MGHPHRQPRQPDRLRGPQPLPIRHLSSQITAHPQINYARPLPFKIEGYKGKAIKAPLPIVPSRRDIILLIRAAERIYRPVLLLCYYGGLRKTEALTIQGRKINFAHGYMVVRGKGNKERIVPMFRKLRVHLHLLRHGFGTHSIMSGIGLRSVQMIMGHSSAQVTEIYTTLAGQFLSHELDKFGGDHGAGHNGKPLKKLTKSAA